MLTRRLVRSFQKLLRLALRLPRIVIKKTMTWLLRGLLARGHRRQFAKAGFVLPTTVLLTLVVALTIGALTFRTFNRTSQAIGEREQQVIQNAATPAIDRARAKVEELFKNDPRFPGGVPNSDVLISMMLDVSYNNTGVPERIPGPETPYTFPDETQIDINKDGNPDTAWVFPYDSDGDGTDDQTIAYSILLDTVNGTVNVENSDDQTKATNLIVRNGPISAAEGSSACARVSRSPEGGWYPVTSATLRKTFQISAFVVNNNPANRTVSAIELQQERQVDRGNKWGAWFRNDLEIFPGPALNWNGAMHTEGSLIAKDRLVAHMISSHNSCLYDKQSSEVTVGQGRTYSDDTSFEGQVVFGVIGRNEYGGVNTNAHLYDGQGKKPLDNQFIEVDTDSIDDASTGKPADIALDPVPLYTRNESRHRRTDSWQRDAKWNQDQSQFVKKGRIFNDASPIPYLDDTYRADNRYGPKPVYNNQISLASEGARIGETITGTNAPALTEISPGSADVEAFGLDGYWERRARARGLRLIVGPRLELGNMFGWGGNNDPLYPPTADKNAATTISNQQRQRRTLRDNLAAVQAMAVYHYESNGGSFPLACVAVTSHPGTPETIANSTTFNNITIGTGTFVDTNFLEGKGTNGWPFPAPATSATAFATAIAPTNSLGIALRNLANFAGDPNGGAPSFTPVQDTQVHPYPYMSAWGDFSMLRRVLQRLDSGTPYANLSIADQSTLHTAACTLEMLAYNVRLAQDRYTSGVSSSSLVSLGEDMFSLVDGNTSSGSFSEIWQIFTWTGSPYKDKASEIGLSDTFFSATDWQSAWPDPSIAPNGPSCPTDAAGFQWNCDASQFYSKFKPEHYVAALLLNPGGGSAAQQAEKIAAAEAVINVMRILRDRSLGFKPGGYPLGTGTISGLTWDPATGNTSPTGGGSSTAVFETGCNPLYFTSKMGTGGGLAPKVVGLAVAFCSEANVVRYPALYYLFPLRDHRHAGTSPMPTTYDDTQPAGEDYIADAYVSTTNTSYTYAVNSSMVANVAKDPVPVASWSTLPIPSSTTSGPNSITLPDGSTRYVPFLDRGMFDGRELMSVRMLDIDLGLLTTNNVVSDRWIANVDGPVYAFREDAVREDTIVRPAGTAMNPNGPSFTDPPVPLAAGQNGISTKPVDYYPDPDRRPHGFRLKNGATLNRADSVQSGMTFVSDNMVYIQGDFNLHQNTSGNIIEEFTQRLRDFPQNGNGFYTQDFYTARTTLNPNFALPSGDRWRPVEIVADAIGFLSNNFVDGAISTTFPELSTFETATATNPSYHNQNRPDTRSNSKYPIASASNWIREKPGDATTPVKVDRNGAPLYCNTALIAGCSSSPQPYDGVNPNTSVEERFRPVSEARRRNDLPRASETNINAVIVSGIIPSRAGQTYGGMHNFPRLLEQWDGVNLYFSGAFFQLNFSTSATGLFDQFDCWQASDCPAAGPSVTDAADTFYGAPQRQWGYDVGLQYAPAGPVARRFVTAANTRSEIYRELAVDDVYIKNLRCAVVNGKQVDPAATCS